MSLMELDHTSPRTVSSAPDLRKLRLSCDNCYAAKVKCTKERPNCSRCGNLGAACVYSQSRRAGKPKGSRNSRSGPSGPPSPPPTACSVPGTPHSCSNFGQFVAGRQQHWDLDQLDDNGERGSSTPQSRKTSLNTSYGEIPSDGFGSLITSAPVTSPTLRPSLDFSFGQSTFSPGDASTGDTGLPAFNGGLFGTMPGSMPDLVSGMMPPCDSLPFSTDDMFSLVSLNDMQCPDLSLNINLGDATAGLCNNTCHCSAALQETLGTLHNPSPSFDRLLAVNKAAVNRVTLHLSCSCPPDISSIMLLFVIVTKIVHWYKKSRDGQGSEEVGVTLGTFKMDKEDEHRMKMVLIKSELRKVEMLISRFRDRFERSLDGQDEQVYEANMAFLEQRLQDTIKGL